MPREGSPPPASPQVPVPVDDVCLQLNCLENPDSSPTENEDRKIKTNHELCLTEIKMALTQTTKV